MSAILGLGLDYGGLLDGLRKATDKLMGFTAEGKKMSDTFQKSTGLQVAEAKLRDITAAADRAKLKASEMSAKFEQASQSFKPGSAEFEKAYADMNKANTAADLLSARASQASDNVGKLKNAAGKAAESASTMGDTFARVGGIIAGVFAADKLMDFGKAVIDSTDKTGDAYEATMQAMSEANGYFMRSIATMDFTNLLDGMSKAADAGKQYAESLDDIGDRQRALGIQKDDLEVQIAQQRIIAKNKQLDIQTRKAAVDEIIRLQTMQFAKTKLLADDELNTELTLAASRSGLRKETLADLVKNYDRYSSILDKYADKEASMRAAATETVTTREGFTFKSFNEEKYNAALKELTETEQTYIKWAKGYNMVVEQGAGGRDKIAAAMKGQLQAQKELADHQEGLVKLQNKLYTELIKEDNQQTILGQKRVQASGIIGQLNAEMEKQVALVESSKDPEQIRVAQARVEWLKEEIKALKEKGETLADLNKPRKMDPKTLPSYKDTEPAMQTRDGLVKQTKDTTKELTRLWGEYAIETEEISKIISDAFQNAFNVVGQKMLAGLKLAQDGWEGFLGGMIETVTKLISMALSQSIANAIVGATTSAAATGPGAIFAQPAFISTAVGGVLAAFAAIPKFAKGGIATRPTLGIFGEAGPEALVPLDRAGNMGIGGGKVQVAVVGQLQGRELRIVNRYADRAYQLKTGRR